MKWKNVKAEIYAQPVAQLVKGWTAVDIVKLFSDRRSSPLVTVSEGVRVKINDHLQSSRLELGGLLLGNVVSYGDLSDGIVAIRVVNAVKSDISRSTPVSLSMDSGVWLSASEVSSRDTFVIGWYHSHPNLGAFFSSVDRKTQADFFNHPYSLGLVVDPIRGEEKWFLGAGSQEVERSYISNR